MEDFIGSIHPWAINYAPVDWAFCDGRLLQITEYQELYSIIGCTYGGDQVHTFALPDLRGRFALPACSAIAIPPAQIGGASTVALTVSNMPAHKHALTLNASQSCNTTTGTQTNSPKDNFPGVASLSGATCYSDTATSGAYMAPLEQTITEATSGSGDPHENMPPYLACNFIICLRGLYPQFD